MRQQSRGRLSGAWCRIAGRVGLAHGRITDIVLYIQLLDTDASYLVHVHKFELCLKILRSSY
jgi:hypothetical protein